MKNMFKERKIGLLEATIFDYVEVSSLKIGRTCCKPEKFTKNICNSSQMNWWKPDKRIIPPYVTGVKHSMHMT